MAKPLGRLPLFVSTIAAIIVLTACIVIHAPLYWMALWVSVAIVAFYFIGCGLRIWLLTAVFPQMGELPGYDDDEEGSYDDEGPQDEYQEDDYQDETLLEEDDDDLDENEPVEDAFLDS